MTAGIELRGSNGKGGPRAKTPYCPYARPPSEKKNKKEFWKTKRQKKKPKKKKPKKENPKKKKPFHGDRRAQMERWPFT
jgi:hypothetical protein